MLESDSDGIPSVVTSGDELDSQELDCQELDCQELDCHEIGRIVIPKRGRDRNIPMVILRTEGEFCWIANGALRKIANPKKKKYIHIQHTNKVAIEIRKRLLEGRNISDADIRKSIVGFVLSQKSL